MYAVYTSKFALNCLFRYLWYERIVFLFHHDIFIIIWILTTLICQFILTTVLVITPGPLYQVRLSRRDSHDNRQTLLFNSIPIQ